MQGDTSASKGFAYNESAVRRAALDIDTPWLDRPTAIAGASYKLNYWRTWEHKLLLSKTARALPMPARGSSAAALNRG